MRPRIASYLGGLLLVGLGALTVPDILPALQAAPAPSEAPALTWPAPFTEADFVVIQPGRFRMGSTNGESNERPVRAVTISRSFSLQRTEVTQAQWQRVMGFNPSRFKRCPQCPVENVSWDEVHQFITRLNQQAQGGGFRLPTEAEWEYAARAGTIGDYGGTGVLYEMGWYEWNSRDRSRPVGQKQPNAWGLYDMHGNAWEWVQDWYQADYYVRAPGTDPPGPASGNYRVLRGGSRHNIAIYARSAYRSHGYPSHRNYNYGFRLARTF